MQLFFYFISVLLLAYSGLMFLYTKWFIKIKSFIVEPNTIALTSFTIIIPARNEALNIANCITSICKNNYPTNLYEVIIADDFSTDKTSEIVEQLITQFSQVRLIKLSNVLINPINSYKKKSIETAIEASKNDYIICTDADCIVTNNWLTNYDAFIQKNSAVFIAAPVEFIQEKTILSKFQYIDFLGMQTITAATVHAGFQTMCNGANLAYKKQVFYEVQGFKGIDDIASGDDMLLMEKIKAKHPQKVGYLFSKEAVVKTNAATTLKEFLNQRIRWASKSKSYKDANVLVVLILVYLLNIGLFFGIFIGIFNLSFLVKIVALIVSKSIVEYVFLNQSKNLFSSFSYFLFLLLQPFHITYIVVAGWLGYFKKYEWKGRTVQ